jgi:hypothetical protein
MESQLEYGNWIRKKVLLLLGAGTLGIGALALLPLGPLYRLAITFLFVIAFVTFLFPLYSYVMFLCHVLAKGR